MWDRKFCFMEKLTNRAIVNPQPRVAYKLNSLWYIWQHKSGSTLAQVMAWCLTATSHYLNHCCFIIKCVLWYVQYRKSYSGDKTILRPSYLHNGVSYTGKTRSVYWIGALVPRWPIGKVEGSWSLPGTISLPWWRTSSFPRAEDTYVGGPKICMYGPTIGQIHIPLCPGNILFDSLWPSDAISMG